MFWCSVVRFLLSCFKEASKLSLKFILEVNLLFKIVETNLISKSFENSRVSIL